MDVSRLEEELKDLRKEHIQALQGFVQAPSANPPGDTREAVEYLKIYLSKQGIPFDVHAPQKDKPNIVASFEGELGPGPHVVLNGHIDVFPVGNVEKWQRDPWSGFNDGEYIHGRGTVDMKSGTAALLMAYIVLYKRRASLCGKLTLTMVSDEETGGKWGAKWLLENLSRECRGDVCLNAEPGGLESIRWGEKGTLRITMQIETKGALGTYLNLSEGANRIGVRLCSRLVEEIEKLQTTIPDSLRKYLQRPEVRQVIDDIMGKGASDLTLKPTVNIGTWHGGLKVNMIPSSAEIQIDIRLPPGMQKEQVLEKIDEILVDFPEVTLKVQEAASNPSNLSAQDHPIVQCITKHVKSTMNIEPVRIPGLGGTDAKHWRYAGVPAYTYGLSPMTMASTSERVSIKEYCSLINIYAHSLYEYLSLA